MSFGKTIFAYHLQKLLISGLSGQEDINVHTFIYFAHASSYTGGACQNQIGGFIMNVMDVSHYLVGKIDKNKFEVSGEYKTVSLQEAKRLKDKFEKAGYLASVTEVRENTIYFSKY